MYNIQFKIGSTHHCFVDSSVLNKHSCNYNCHGFESLNRNVFYNFGLFIMMLILFYASMILFSLNDLSTGMPINYMYFILSS